MDMYHPSSATWVIGPEVKGLEETGPASQVIFCGLASKINKHSKTTDHLYIQYVTHTNCQNLHLTIHFTIHFTTSHHTFQDFFTPTFPRFHLGCLEGCHFWLGRDSETLPTPGGPKWGLKMGHPKSCFFFATIDFQELCSVSFWEGILI